MNTVCASEWSACQVASSAARRSITASAAPDAGRAGAASSLGGLRTDAGGGCAASLRVLMPGQIHLPHLRQSTTCPWTWPDGSLVHRLVCRQPVTETRYRDTVCGPCRSVRPRLPKSSAGS